MTTCYRNFCAVIVGALLFSVQTWASGRISQVRVVDGTAELTVETEANERYQLQCSTNLVSGAWSDLGSEFVANAATTARTAAADASNCYFRVIIVISDELVGPTSPPPPPPPPPPES